MKFKIFTTAGALALASVVWLGTMPISASAEDSVTEAKSNIVDENAALTLASITETEDVKENIFNNLLNNIDYYDAVEGEFTTTLWADEDGEPATVSYVTDINTQQSYQKLDEEQSSGEVYVTDGKKYTFDNLARTYSVEYIGGNNIEREKQVQDIFLVADRASSLSQNSNESRVGVKDGVPIYYYRNDLTNADFAKVSIFPQTLTFGLLTDMDNWDIVDVTNYLDRDAIVIEGTISDPIYSEKINAKDFRLIVDSETGIILEFTGYDSEGNETESIETTNINIIKDSTMQRGSLTGFIDSELKEKCAEYDEENISASNLSEYTPSTVAATGRISALIDNDTIDSEYYNERGGFLAYLNDSNYYNEDMRRAESNDGDDYYSWYVESGVRHDWDSTIEVDLEVYLYSSTSRDPAAAYRLGSQGMVAFSAFGIDTLDQGTAPNGWNAISKEMEVGNDGTIYGIEMGPSGRGSTYTGADAVDYTIRVR